MLVTNKTRTSTTTTYVRQLALCSLSSSFSHHTSPPMLPTNSSLLTPGTTKLSVSDLRKPVLVGLSFAKEHTLFLPAPVSNMH